MSTTFPAIEARVIEPIRAAGHNTTVDLFITRSRGAVINTRSGEAGRSEWDLPESAAPYRVRTFNADRVDRRSWPTWRRARAAGDPWPESNFKNLRNHVGMLKLLDIASRGIDDGADAVLYVRPDLLPLDDFDIDRYADLVRTSAVLPYWHTFMGHNDRVALLPPAAARRYFTRIRLVKGYLTGRRVLHAERFLKYSLADFPVAQVMTERFARSRIGGVIATEDFEKKVPTERLLELGIIPGSNGERAASSR